MDIFTVAKDFGWLAVIVGWVLNMFFPRLWTFLTDKVFPARAKERARKLEQEEKDAQVKREVEVTLLKAKLDREMRAEESRIENDKRLATAMEQMALAITANNERVSNIASGLDRLTDFTVDAVGDMREKVARLNKSESQPKIPKIKRPAKKP